MMFLFSYTLKDNQKDGDFFLEQNAFNHYECIFSGNENKRAQTSLLWHWPQNLCLPLKIFLAEVRKFVFKSCTKLKSGSQKGIKILLLPRKTVQMSTCTNLSNGSLHTATQGDPFYVTYFGSFSLYAELCDCLGSVTHLSFQCVYPYSKRHDTVYVISMM